MDKYWIKYWIQVALAFLVFILCSGVIVYYAYYNRFCGVEPGQIWVIESKPDNPFVKPDDPMYYFVLDVKKGYVLYKYTNSFNECMTNTRSIMLFKCAKKVK